jgi:uncharacterized protein
MQKDLDIAVGAARFTPFDRALLLAVIVCPFLLFLVGTSLKVAAIPMSLAVAYFWWRNFALFARSLFWPLFLICVLALPWPFGFVAPLVAYLSLYWRWPRFRTSVSWLVLGKFTKRATAWMVPTVLISSGALLAWVFLFRPDLSDLARMVPPGGTTALIGVGIAFSILNATWEELIFKGIAWNSLQLVFTRDWQINMVQSVLFGIAHAGGFPRGRVGILMATLYGFMLGIIRKESGGLLVPIVTHVFADATIFVVLYCISVGILSVP